MAKKYPNLGKALKKLLFDRDMKPADLSREVNIPQPTIHRFITGKSTRPYKSSLKPIADYFSVSIDQLLGEEPLDTDQPNAKQVKDSQLTSSRIQLVPLIPWGELGEKENKDYEKVPFLGQLNTQSFATILQDSSMEPQFSKGNILILDPMKSPFDRSYVLVRLAESKLFIFRQLLIDAEHKFLKPLNPDLNTFKMRLLDSHDEIVATLVEARHVYLDP